MPRLTGGTEQIGLSAGTGGHTPLPSWMVVYDRRLFVRSWTHAERSRHGGLAREGVGTIYPGESHVPVAAVPVEDDESVRTTFEPAPKGE